MNKLLLFVVIFLLFNVAVVAQDSTKSSGKFTFNGYAEFYYGYDFNKPADHNRPGFVYSYNRTNELNLNLGYIEAAYTNAAIRANLAFMAGTYTNANLQNEPGTLKNIYEANAGVRLSRSADLWLDAGVLLSHIGYESAEGMDCWALTRNIASDNTPYFETGARLTYVTKDSTLTLAALYLNGWQRIQREDGNNKPAGGIQFSWSPTSKFTINYSNYLGTEGADSVSVIRFYNNFYAIWQMTKKFGLTMGFDYGMQEKSHNSGDYYSVISPVAVARYTFAEKWAVAGRVEYYQDKNGVFIQTVSPNGFKATGYSANIDYAPLSNAMIRLEGKIYDASANVFMRNGSYVGTSPVITASFALSF